VCFKKGLVGWKSQTQRPSIQEISKWLSVRWSKNLKPVLKIRAEG
jgi:hypothetical protein